ncbi:3-oxoacyl-ACP reductase FabG [Phenylobacterium sp. LjRoot219]|uniref:SDR family NAD(P)-dependent oxidoreductase n=1 Tax=Phenylobacterium sp. LjRoot219 TaxID=3342283 RepID=UPI003ECC561C
MSQAEELRARRVALVTGGGAGIGEATCLRLAREGHAVGVLGRDPANIGAVAQAIVEAGGAAVAVTADVADRGQVDAALATVRRTLGPVTILVNNAGIEDFTPFAEVGEDLWDRLMAVNLKGVYHVTQAVLPDMLAAHWGRIVNLTALGAQSGAANMVHYTATKGGVVAMTRSLAVELGAQGVTVNNVSPGFVLTPMAQRAIDGGLFPVPPEQIVAAYPIPRVGRPEEVAAAIAFFASEDAGYVTGQTLGVNGGCFT